MRNFSRKRTYKNIYTYENICTDVKKIQNESKKIITEITEMDGKMLMQEVLTLIA